MTIPAGLPSEEYFPTDGVTTTFPLALIFARPADIKARWTDALGVATALAQETDFTVTTTGPTGAQLFRGGNLNTTAILPAGGSLYVWRETVVEQPTDYVDGDPFPADSHERELDRSRLIETELVREEARAVRLPRGETLDMSLPPKALRAGRVLGFDLLGRTALSTPTLQDLANILVGGYVTAGGQVGPDQITDDPLLRIAALDKLGAFPAEAGFRIDLIQHGAKGDYGLGGTPTDDAPTLRSALELVGLWGGGEVHIPGGRQYYLEEMFLPAGDPSYTRRFATLYPNVRITGGPGATLVAAPGLSAAGPINFFVGRFDSDFDHISVVGLTFNFNGANNLTPSGAYRPNVAVWVQLLPGASGRRVLVQDCDFIDNPGANSVSVVDEAPTGGRNRLTDLIVSGCLFRNFGYAVSNSANIHQDDHSAIYAAARRTLVEGNTCLLEYTPSNLISVGLTFLDLHSEEAVVQTNIIDNVMTVIAHQCNGVLARDILIAANVCTDIECLYRAFDGDQLFENITIGPNVLSMIATTRNYPCIDLWSALTTTQFSNLTVVGVEAVWRSAIGGSFAGMESPFLKARRGDNMTIKGNGAFTCPGRGIVIDASGGAVDVLNLDIDGNRIVAYGAGEVAGERIGIDIDLGGGPGEDSAMLTRNRLSKGTLAPARDIGIRYAGAMRKLTIHTNEFDGVTANVSTPSDNVLTRYVERGRWMASALLNFAAPGAVPGSPADQTVSVPGVKVGDIVEIAPAIAIPAGFVLQGFVSAPNVVSIRWTQYYGAATDPDGAGCYYRVAVQGMV